MSVAEIDAMIEELKRRREDYLDERPTRELRREQLLGKVLMEHVRQGDGSANYWLAVAAEESGDEAWLFDADYLTGDGYQREETEDGKSVWKLKDRRT